MTLAASRDGYGAALLDMANDERIVVLEADLGKSTKSCLFRAEHPNRSNQGDIDETLPLRIGIDVSLHRATLSEQPNRASRAPRSALRQPTL